VWSGHVTRFKNKFCPNHSFGLGEARHFKFRVLTDTYTSALVPPKGMCDVPRDILKFREISDNISLKVQDRDIVAMEHQ